MRDEELEWMKEKVPSVPHSNWLYKLCCFLLFKRKAKLNYYELFMILYGINKKGLGIDEAKRFAMAQILKIYKFHNNKLPNHMKEDDKG